MMTQDEANLATVAEGMHAALISEGLGGVTSVAVHGTWAVIEFEKADTGMTMFIAVTDPSGLD